MGNRESSCRTVLAPFRFGRSARLSAERTVVAYAIALAWKGSRYVESRTAVGLLVIAAAGAPAAAQLRSDYPALVRLYAAGRSEDAVRVLLDWRRDDLSRAVKTVAVSSELTPQELVAAAVLHTEALIPLLDHDEFGAAFHAGLAHSLLQIARREAERDGAARTRIEAVARRWYAFTASAFVSARAFRQADWWVGEGLREFPREAPLYVVRGTIAEMTADRDGDLRRERPSDRRQRDRIESQLKHAADEYGRALNVDSHLAIAHLHAGWIRTYLHEAGARSDLEAAAADAATDHLRYLAHLFLGALAEQEHRIDDAEREYTSAAALGPRYQSACVALSRVEDLLGRAARAREVARDCLRIPKPAEDAWWDYKAQFDRDALASLQGEARAR